VRISGRSSPTSAAGGTHQAGKPLAAPTQAAVAVVRHGRLLSPLLLSLALLLMAGLGMAAPHGASATDATTTSLGSTPNPSVFGETVTLTASVSGCTSTPTGNADFFDGATLLNNATLDAGGNATITVGNLAVGAHSLTAIYNGDSNCSVSTSSVATQNVGQAATGTSLNSAPNPSVFGQTTILTATVTVVAPGSDTPTGTASFFDGATLLGTAPLNGSGQASFATSALPVGANSLTAVYGGDTNNTGSTSPVDTQTVNAASTTTSVSGAPDPSVFGQAVTLTATVSAVPPGAGTPTGTVDFFNGATLLGTGTLNGSGQATLTTSGLPLGSSPITAVYGSDANFSGSTSSVDTLTVGRASTTTTLSGSPNPSLIGQAVTFTATVTVTPPGAGAPTGTVSFFDGGNLLGTGTVAGGVASLSTTTLTAGAHSITAVYSGDASFNGSASPVFSQSVNLTGTTTTLGASPNPSMLGQSVTLTATVVCPTFVPTGTVSFFDGATPLGTGPLVGGGANISTSALAVGPHSLIAVYSGDGNCAASTSPVASQVVNTAGSTTQLTATPNLVGFGQPVMLDVSVACTGFVATGTVTFADGATSLGTAVLDGTGHASLLPLSAFAVGTHALSVTYPGDANCAASSATAMLTVVAQQSFTSHPSFSPAPSQPPPYGGNGADPRCYYNNCGPNGLP
jgi:hypothetical protein